MNFDSLLILFKYVKVAIFFSNLNSVLNLFKYGINKRCMVHHYKYFVSSIYFK